MTLYGAPYERHEKIFQGFSDNIPSGGSYVTSSALHFSF